MLKKSLIILGLVLIPTFVFATAQFGDILIYKGTTYSISSEPLESWFGKEHARPNELFKAMCTACWRGYVGTWEIKDDGYLYLVKLVEGSCDMDAPEIPLEKVFPGQKGPIKASWFTGTLVVPQGELLQYVHMGYESIFEKELHIVIKEGRVEKEYTIDNTQKKGDPTEPQPPTP